MTEVTPRTDGSCHVLEVRVRVKEGAKVTLKDLEKIDDRLWLKRNGVKRVVYCADEFGPGLWLIRYAYNAASAPSRQFTITANSCRVFVLERQGKYFGTACETEQDLDEEVTDTHVIVHVPSGGQARARAEQLVRGY
jgi:hypothetical protein